MRPYLLPGEVVETQDPQTALSKTALFSGLFCHSSEKNFFFLPSLCLPLPFPAPPPLPSPPGGDWREGNAGYIGLTRLSCVA